MHQLIRDCQEGGSFQKAYGGLHTAIIKEQQNRFPCLTLLKTAQLLLLYSTERTDDKETHLQSNGLLLFSFAKMDCTLAQWCI